MNPVKNINTIKVLYLYEKILTVFLFVFSGNTFSQVDSTITLTFDFNNHEIKEKDNKVLPKGKGLLLTKDRFGNERSAIYTQGHNTSYLNLSTSPLLKSHIMSISLWVNIERRVYEGKGYDCNPILGIKNSPAEDFSNAYAMAYECYNGRIGANSNKDSTKGVNLFCLKPFIFNKWYHVVYICTDEYLSLYLNGELQSKAEKGFVTQFLRTDSITIGHSASKKNERYSQASFDDIQFFHRVLSEKEILDLYHAPNPNEFRNFLDNALKYGSIILLLIVVIITLIIRNKRNLRKQKEQFELINKITELELKVVKAQINPHFISNSLAAIQELIYKNDVEKAGQYIAKFSFFLRQVLNYSDKNYITIAEEIEIIKLNVELEQLRFKNGFSFELYVDKTIDIEEVWIPSLITQPFIENAVWHGLLTLNNVRPPRLKVQIRSINDYIIIEIEDNGTGRNVFKASQELSKGTKLVLDKMESLNRLSGQAKHQLEIVDLKDTQDQALGTLISIRINLITE